MVKFSSNIGITKINERMDGNRFYDMIRAFGFGSRTGIELRGEVRARCPPAAASTAASAAPPSPSARGISVTPSGWPPGWRPWSTAERS